MKRLLLAVAVLALLAVPSSLALPHTAQPGPVIRDGEYCPLTRQECYDALAEGNWFLYWICGCPYDA